MADNENTNPEILLNQSELYSYLGTGGGNINYSSLGGKPTINGHLVEGDKTGADYGLVDVSDLNNINSSSELFINFIKNFVNIIYPIGSIYMSMNDTSPSTLFPGTTWERIRNEFLLSASGSDEIPTEYPNKAISKPSKGDTLLLSRNDLRLKTKVTFTFKFSSDGASGNVYSVTVPLPKVSNNFTGSVLTNSTSNSITVSGLTDLLSGSGSGSGVYTAASGFITTPYGKISVYVQRSRKSGLVRYYLGSTETGSGVFTKGLRLYSISYDTTQAEKLIAGNTGGYSNTILPTHSHPLDGTSLLGSAQHTLQTNTVTKTHAHWPQSSGSTAGTHFLVRNQDTKGSKGSAGSLGAGSLGQGRSEAVKKVLSTTAKGAYYTWMADAKIGFHSQKTTDPVTISHSHTVSLSGNVGKVGEDVEDSNFPSYLVVNMWKRTE